MNVEIEVPFVDFKRRYALQKSEIDAAVQAVFGSGNYILGEYVEEFERKVSQYLGCPYVLAVANGTDAIIMALKAFNIGVGDEVVVPVNSFVASAGAVAAVGAIPVFCDVTEDLNIDVIKLPRLINKRTKVILPVHLTGRPANMVAVLKIAKQHKLKVIEDAAQSIGAKYQGQMTGCIGDVGCFSLHPLKNLHVYGDGGLITVNDEKLYQQLKLMRNHGLKDRDTCVAFGLNSRLDSVQAKIASLGMEHLNQWTERRRYIAQLYRDGLKNLVTVPVDASGDFSVYHNFVILTQQRDALAAFLQKQGVDTRVHYPIPLHLQPAASYLGYKTGDFPVAERLAKEMLSLPVFPELKDVEVQKVVKTIQDFFRIN